MRYVDRPSSGAAGPSITLVLMGVSGVGKSTVMAALEERMDARFAEGDDFHPNRTSA